MKNKNPTLSIDVASIPDFRRIELAKGALALTEQVFSMPGAEERYQAWLKERRAKQKKHIGSVGPKYRDMNGGITYG